MNFILWRETTKPYTARDPRTPTRRVAHALGRFFTYMGGSYTIGTAAFSNAEGFCRYETSLVLLCNFLSVFKKKRIYESGGIFG